MRRALALVLLSSSVWTSGCALIEDGTRNTVLSLRAPFERHSEWARNRRWAEAAWAEVCGTEGVIRSDDHADGFKQGFAEYLYRGGDGEPPLLPPLHYRKLRYQTPDGHAAIEEWFAGYRHGAGVARASGARRWITAPTSLPPHMPPPGAIVQVGPRVPPAHFLVPLPAPLQFGAPATLRAPISLGAVTAAPDDPITLPPNTALVPVVEPSTVPPANQPPDEPPPPGPARLQFGLPQSVTPTPAPSTQLPPIQVPVPPPDDPDDDGPDDEPPASIPVPAGDRRMP